MNPEPKDPRTRKVVRAYAQAGPYITMGTQFTASMLLGLLGGWWLDKTWSISPLFLILGTFLGAGAGFYHLYKVLMAEEQERKKKQEEQD